MEKRKYWLKLSDDFFKGEEMISLWKMDNGERLTLYYIILLHESITTNGILDNPMEMLLTLTDNETAKQAVTVFRELGLIVLTPNGWKLTKADIGSESKCTERVRKMRERKAGGNVDTQEALHCNTTNETAQALHCNSTALHCNNGALHCNGQGEKERYIVTASDLLVDIRSKKNSMYNLVMNRNEIEMNSREYYYDKEENKSRGNTARGCAYIQAILDKQTPLEKYIDICNVITEDVSLDQDRATQKRFGTFMRDLGKYIDSQKSIIIKGNDISATEFLDTFREAMETGESDELFIRTIRDVTAKTLDGKVQSDQKAYLLSTLYERIKAGGVI